MARKNLIVILIYIAASRRSSTRRLPCVMIALPATMYFLPERGIEKFNH